MLNESAGEQGGRGGAASPRAEGGRGDAGPAVKAGRGHYEVERVGYAALACACLCSNYCRAQALQYGAHARACCPAMHLPNNHLTTIKSPKIISKKTFSRENVFAKKSQHSP